MADSRLKDRGIIVPGERGSRHLVAEWKEIADGQRTFLASDTHFDHANIMRKCKRRFADVETMNYVMLNNWNSTVGENDTVYFLGDLTGSTSEDTQLRWLSMLNGNITLIEGNHDVMPGMLEYETVTCGGMRFYLVHYPQHIPSELGEDVWTIHGHMHNNDLQNYPFINGANKTINVSVELTGFRPVSFDRLLSLDLERIRRMDTIDSEPEYT